MWFYSPYGDVKNGLVVQNEQNQKNHFEPTL